MRAARKFESKKPEIDAALKFVKTLLETHGHPDDSSIEAVRKAGYGDGEIAELVANVALNVLTNYTNETADTDIDFPLAPELP